MGSGLPGEKEVDYCVSLLSVEPGIGTINPERGKM
jgi:hypothetical protein